MKNLKELTDEELREMTDNEFNLFYKKHKRNKLLQVKMGIEAFRRALTSKDSN